MQPRTPRSALCSVSGRLLRSRSCRRRPPGRCTPSFGARHPSVCAILRRAPSFGVRTSRGSGGMDRNEPGSARFAPPGAKSSARSAGARWGREAHRQGGSGRSRLRVLPAPRSDDGSPPGRVVCCVGRTWTSPARRSPSPVRSSRRSAPSSWRGTRRPTRPDASRSMSGPLTSGRPTGNGVRLGGSLRRPACHVGARRP